MDSTGLLNELGYAGNAHFLSAGSEGFLTAPAHGHIFRQAQSGLPTRLEDEAELLGVYTLSGRDVSEIEGQIPLVYVCRAGSRKSAAEIHRLVWCQDIVPFVLICTPSGLSLHSGFHFERKRSGLKGILQPLKGFNECQDLIRSFHADSIDSGRIWHRWRKSLSPEKRVDWKLLENLRKLGLRLEKMGLHRETAHSLIGKYVFLHYLNEREILSNRKLKSWGLRHGDVFKRSVTVKRLRTCVEKLEEWLNGGVFPISWSGPSAPKAEHVRAVAATFSGDEPQGSDYWQLSFDFDVYDFSYIPIETLSVIYEQFLHAPGEAGRSRGKDLGAYYTPIPLVNFMLSELEERKPISKGTRVFDPACGSGAFLVQAYRHLIEREFPPTGPRPNPSQLKSLLINHIYGVDRDPEACRVTELSLLLTLLDCVEPPDLEESGPHRRFKLPTLRGENIVCGDLFDASDKDIQQLQIRPFDVVLGNPPWKSLNPKKLDADDADAWNWIKEHGGATGQTPIGGNQVAQAFTWRIDEFLKEDGEVAFLIPGMTLFEPRSRYFRSRLFSKYKVQTVVNFSNLAEVLFAGRSRVPAAAFFFSKFTMRDEHWMEDEHWIRTFSPLIANQEANRPSNDGERLETWAIEVHGDEIRDIPQSAVRTGDGLPWKVATWGSYRDLRLLDRLSAGFDSFNDLEEKEVIVCAQGPDLRENKVIGGDEAAYEVEELTDRVTLDVDALETLRHIFRFPVPAIVQNQKFFLRKRGGEKGLKVCRPPHMIVSAARLFAVYSDEYIVVPPRQVGIISPSNDCQFLKALSLYLSSDFAYYHQFLTSTHFGVKRDVATLRALRDIPVPLTLLSKSELQQWAGLHAKLEKTRPRTLDEVRNVSTSLFPDEDDGQNQLLQELNERVYDALGMSERDRSLVRDLVHVRLALNDGHIGRAAVSAPDTETMKRYGKRLQSELDGFVGEVLPKRHEVSIIYDEVSGMVAVELVRRGNAIGRVSVQRADHASAKELQKARERLRREYSQWIYFNRNLRVHDRGRTYILKPLQRFHWTESQAMQDASEIVAELVGTGAMG